MGTLATLALGDEVKMLKSTSCFPHTPESRRLEPIPHTGKFRHCEPKVTERSRRILESATMIAAESRTCHCEPRRGVAILGRLLLAFLLALFLAIPAAAADKLDKLDSARMTTLNMTDEQIAEVYGIDSTKLATGPTLQELNEENPSYIKREYDHKQQVVVGSVVMFCVTLAMILMNNYNPKR